MGFQRINGRRMAKEIRPGLVFIVDPHPEILDSPEFHAATLSVKVARVVIVHTFESDVVCVAIFG